MSMDLHELFLVTLVAEPVLEDHLTRDLTDHGATGFTVSEVTGRGTRGIRTGDIPGQNVRIETVVTNDYLNKWFTLILKNYDDLELFLIRVGKDINLLF